MSAGIAGCTATKRDATVNIGSRGVLRNYEGIATWRMSSLKVEYPLLALRRSFRCKLDRSGYGDGSGGDAMQSEGLPPEFSQYFPDILEPHVAMVARAFVALPFAAILGAALAFRPRARGTPPRSAPVIQTQIVLAVVGSVVMLIVGSNLARAFGIVGVASLIRYRAKIDDPKDATVMLASLSLGLACGVELYGLAVFATLFTLVVLWVVESLEPERRKTFELKVTAPEPVALRARIESTLRQHGVQ